MSPAPVTPNNFADVVAAPKSSATQDRRNSSAQFADVLNKITPRTNDREASRSDNKVSPRSNDRDAPRSNDRGVAAQQSSATERDKTIASQPSDKAARRDLDDTSTPEATEDAPGNSADTAASTDPASKSVAPAEGEATTTGVNNVTVVDGELHAATVALSAASLTAAAVDGSAGATTGTTPPADLAATQQATSTTPSLTGTLVGTIATNPETATTLEAAPLTAAAPVAGTASGLVGVDLAPEATTGSGVATATTTTAPATTATATAAAMPGPSTAVANAAVAIDADAVGTPIAAAPAFDNAVTTSATPAADSPDLLAGLPTVKDGSTTTLTSAVTGAVTDPKIAAITTEAASAKAAIDALTTTARAADPVQNPATATKLVASTMQTEPYKQVVNVVAPLKHLKDGDYSMTLKLHPEHLGSVEIVVALSGGQINLSMNSDNAASRQMLRDSMNELRNSLEESGLNAGSLDVGSQAQSQQQQSGRAARQLPGFEDAPVDDPLARFNVSVAATAAADGPLDVRL